MNVFQAVSVVIATCCAFLGVTVLIKNRITYVNLLFLISCLLSALTLVVYTLIWWNPDRHGMEVCNTVSLIIVMFNFSLILHFLIEFTNYRIRKFFKIFLYVPAVVISIATVFSKEAFSGFVWENGHWVAFPPYGGIWGLVFVIFFICLFRFPIL